MSVKNLVVTSMGHFDLDRLIAVIVFTKGLQRKTNSVIDLLINFNVDLATLSHYVDLKGINLQQQLTTTQKSLTVSLKDFQGDIEEVKWTKVDGEMRLQIFTNQTKINPDSLEVKPNTLDYDQIFTVGVNNAAYLQKLLHPYALPTDLKITALNKGADEPDFAQQKFVDKNSLAFAELVWNYLQSIQAALLPHELTELLTAIYWRTNALRNSYTSNHTFKTVESLVSGGALLHIAAQKAFQQDKFSLEVQKQVLESMAVNQKYAFSRISTELSTELLKHLDVYPDFNPLANLREYNASFILIPSGSNIEVVANSHHKSVNLKRSFKRFRYRGDNVTGRFTLFTQDLTKAEESIIQALNYEASPKLELQQEAQPAKSDPITEPKVEAKPEVKPISQPSQPTISEVAPPAVTVAAMAQGEAGEDLAEAINMIDLTETTKPESGDVNQTEEESSKDKEPEFTPEIGDESEISEDQVPATQASLFAEQTESMDLRDTYTEPTAELKAAVEDDPLPAANW